jgi:endo-1,4-beta-xylanase
LCSLTLPSRAIFVLAGCTDQGTPPSQLREHIKAEVQHFGSQEYAWDVVNEPLDPSQPDCLVHGPFYQALGKSYIDIALEAAREYAPAGTKLLISEYSTSDPSRLACLVRVVRDLQNRGIPIDAVGHEMHNDINYPSAEAMEQAMRTVAQLGVDQQVTELDLSVYKAGDNTSNYAANGGTVPLSVIAQQGYLYKQYFDVFRRMRHYLSGVTFWVWRMTTRGWTASRSAAWICRFLSTWNCKQNRRTEALWIPRICPATD